MIVDLKQPDADVGDEFAGHNLEGRGGHGQKILHGAALTLASDGQAGHTMVMVRMTPISPGTTLYWVMPSGL